MPEASHDAKQGLLFGNRESELSLSLKRRSWLRQRQLCTRGFFPALLCLLPHHAEGSAFEILSLPANVLGDFTGPAAQYEFESSGGSVFWGFTDLPWGRAESKLPTVDWWPGAWVLCLSSPKGQGGI